MPWVNEISFPLHPMRFTDDKIRFIWCTDMHISTEAVAPYTSLQAAVEDCNAWRPNAFIASGDLGNSLATYTRRAGFVMRRAQRPLIAVVDYHDEEEITLGQGNPNTVMMEKREVIGQTAPFYRSTILSSGDDTFSLLVLMLDQNFYNDIGNPVHQVGDRFGYFTTDPGGGYKRQLGAAQLAWVAATLAANPSCDGILIVTHVPPGQNAVVDEVLLADVLQTDGRPAIGLCGHNHNGGYTYTLTSTDTQATYTFYKCPGMQESGAWTRATLSFAGGAIAVDSMVVHNYTDPGEWVINAPFTLAT